MTVALILGVSMAPVIFIFTYIYLKDKFEREPLRLLIYSFLLGVVSTFIAIFTEVYLEKIIGTAESGDVLHTFISAFFVVALTEESVKYIPLRFFIYPKKEFNEPYDGIMYGVAISLGFAALENLFYVIQHGLETGILRMFTAVPGHAMFGVIMGFFMGNAKFSHRGPIARMFIRLTGLFLAVVFHGLYDFFLFLDHPVEWVSLLAFVVLVIGIILALKAMKIHQKISPHNNPFDNE